MNLSQIIVQKDAIGFELLNVRFWRKDKSSLLKCHYGLSSWRGNKYRSLPQLYVLQMYAAAYE